MKNNKIKVLYEKDFDSLNIYLNTAEDFYTEEIEEGVYVIKDSSTHKVLGYDIFNISKRKHEELSKIMPEWIVDYLFSKIE